MRIITGFPRSGKSQWKMKKVQGQGKVREFGFESGKFEILEKVREKSGNFIKTTCHIFECWLYLFTEVDQCDLILGMFKLLDKCDI